MSEPRSREHLSSQALSPALQQVLAEVRRATARHADQGSALDAGRAVSESAARIGLELSSYERDEVLSHIESDSMLFGVLQPLIDDPRISDITVSGFSSISVQQARRSLRTQLRFPDQRSYEAYVEKLLHRAGTSYSTKQPIADGMAGSLVRVHAIHRSLCEDGPYLTIRINRFTSVSIDGLAEAGLAPRPVFDYLAGVVAIGRTLLVVGEVGTGKTTLARALASTIPHDESVLVIEDTPEIRLDHPHVRYVTTREENLEGSGRVSPAQCIRAGMRMAMNRIIFGEIRDAEAAEAFVDVCASGHPGLSTLHARNAADAITRLELFLARAQRSADRGILGSQIATAVQVVAIVDVCRVTGVRRIVEVREVGPVAEGVLRHRDIFLYRVVQGVPTWIVAGRVSAFREKLEREAAKFSFAALPETICLDERVAYREAAQSMRR